MPTPDASQFTQLKKYTAIAGRRVEGEPQSRTLSHLHQSVPSVVRPLDFLASFTNKYTSNSNFTPINRVTGRQAKPKVPGGNVNGQSGSFLSGGDGGGGGTGTGPPVPAIDYTTTTVTNQSFINDEAIFSKTIVSTSPFNVSLAENDASARFGYYFDLTNLDTIYGLSSRFMYTFEITEAIADINEDPPIDDTVIALFGSQTKPFSSQPISINDDISLTPLIRRSKLSDQNLGDNDCLVVAFFRQYTTGTFTLKITRTRDISTTTVTNASFVNNEVTFRRAIMTTSPFTYPLQFEHSIYIDDETNRYGHYFNLNSLSTDYLYSFETTAANIPNGIYHSDDTQIVLFYTQTPPFSSGDFIEFNDQKNEGGGLSELLNKNIDGNYCLVVTSYDPLLTGTFTLKITRTPRQT